MVGVRQPPPEIANDPSFWARQAAIERILEARGGEN
jgi:hypothetical protein